MMTFEEQNKKEGGKEVDIVWLIRYYWSNRKCICKFLAACMVISVIAYFCRQKKFTCTASVLPLSSQSSNMKGLGMLAGMATSSLGRRGAGSLPRGLAFLRGGEPLRRRHCC